MAAGFHPFARKAVGFGEWVLVLATAQAPAPVGRGPYVEWRQDSIPFQEKRYTLGRWCWFFGWDVSVIFLYPGQFEK